ncbi:hypothetical protein [Flavipsychrobacter stenotrophus]|uniref:hypothetical protein n=1 Tax=Flavipsychrobacter stenotrophus TaxID=2077091 RepID=UPI001056F59B|nr:hypothetical protein [Flavipsychrobacter stenotrophus]
MRSLIVALFALLIVVGCKKNDSGTQTTTPIVALSIADSNTAVAMRAEYGSMEAMLDSMLATPHHTHQLHWDSLYHHHDSLYWHYHHEYHHEISTHDDHHHTWVHYDSTVDHSAHHHHTYPDAGHEHDSLVIVTSYHTHDNTDHHFHGHDLHEHHVLDSIHHVHELHHP